MQLTKVEKLVLINQYEMLKGIYPNRREDYEVILSALQDGYEQDFEQLVCRSDTPLTEETYKEVRDILEMFRAITGPEGSSVRFAGFDGNEETEHYAYARFLLEERGLWRESRPENNEYNTHFPVLEDYRLMLSEWERLGRRHDLTAEELDQIVSKAPNSAIL